jgi:hypothetical protein
MPRRSIHAVRRSRPVPDELAPEDLDGVPLFEESGDLAYIAVTREDPEEGFLGKLRPSATEADLRKKWGGGTYSLSPRNSGGKYIKGLSAREIIIAGDPVFASKSAEIRWKRSLGIVDEPREAARGGAGGGNLGIGEMLILLNTTSEKARQEARDAAESRMREAEAAHARQLELVREESKRREADLKAERERMHEAAAEREARLVREAASERDRQREHMQTMLQLVKERAKSAEESGGPMGALMAGVKLAMDLRGDGGGPGDPLSALANNLPDVIAEARNLIAMDRGGAPRLNPADQGDEEDEDEDPDSVKFEGEVGAKARELVERIRAQGRDPAVVLARAFDVLARPKTTATAPKTPQPPSAPLPEPPAELAKTEAPAPAEAATLTQHVNGVRPARAARPRARRRTRKSTAPTKAGSV